MLEGQYKMNSGLVSVIMPIYNSGNSIATSVKSVLAQTYNNFELILVDDGSTDNSLLICSELEKTDSRIRLFTKENGGVSSARNLGIKKSMGEFITFLDSDDALEPMFLETLMKRHTSNGILIACAALVNSESGSKEVLWQIKNKGVYEINEVDQLLADKFLFNVVWNKLYESDILLKNKIEFPEDLSLGEDLIFNLSYLLYMNRVIILDEPLYLYTYCGGLSSGYRHDMFDIIDRLYIKKFDLMARVSAENMDRVKLDYVQYFITVLRRYSRHNKSVLKYKYALDSKQLQSVSRELYKKKLISNGLYFCVKHKWVIGCCIYSITF